MRRLSGEEAALWRRVAATVRREEARAVAAEVPRVLNSPRRPGFDPGQGSFLGVAPEAALPRVKSGATKESVTTSEDSNRSVTNTLDATWDRKLSAGRAVPERAIDLHGCSLSAAHARLETALVAAVRDGVRVLLVVTGRAPPPGASRLDRPLRGAIRASIGDWLAASPHARAIAAIRAAHPRHGGAGALYIVLRRAR